MVIRGILCNFMFCIAVLLALPLTLMTVNEPKEDKSKEELYPKRA